MRIYLCIMLVLAISIIFFGVIIDVAYKASEYNNYLNECIKINKTNCSICMIHGFRKILWIEQKCEDNMYRWNGSMFVRAS